MHGSHSDHTALEQRAPSAHGATDSERRLLIVLVLTAGYMVAEVVGGLLANSLALLADAGHMLADSLGLAMALFALRFAQRPATPAKTYGFYRTEILATLANSLVLLGIAGSILFEAWRRFHETPAVSSLPMLVVALGGLLVNLVGVRLLHAGAGASLNLHAAFLEVLGDLLGSLGTIFAALIIHLTGWWPADPLISVLLALFIVARTWRLLKRALDVLLEATPEHLKVEHIEAAMRAVPGVASVHDLHVWTISSGFVAMSGHVQARERSSSEVLHDLQALLRQHFGIEHATLQVEHCEHAGDVACCTLDPRCLIVGGASSVISR
jgi:cobalt-zinc-cadmium efflux system protein